MLFGSTVFLFTFLPVFLIVYYLVPRPLKNAVLLAGSLVFYTWDALLRILPVAAIVLFNYVSALYIGKNLKDKKRAKRRLIFNIAVNLFFMIFLKYGETLYGSVGIVYPMGISFLTLQMLSYSIDVYQKEAKAEKRLLDFAAFAVMFPRIIAGPLVRYKDIKGQYGTRKLTLENLGEGSLLFIRGLAKRVLLAGEAGLIFNKVFSMEAGRVSALTAWLGCAAFGFHIYYGFGGYCDMACGLGRMLGFHLKNNFAYPYVARSVAEFWHRWHTSLRAWFRDYVYLPLGGKQEGYGGNIIIIWLLAALWHGVSLHFLMWGMYCALLFLCENYVWRGVLKRLPSFFGHLYCLIFVTAGWVLFFSPSPGSAMKYLGLMIGMGGCGFTDKQGLYLLVTNGGIWLILVLGAAPAVHKVYERIIYEGRRIKTGINCTVYAVLFFLSVAYLVTEPYRPFLYFRF
ncbi:MAG: MBOAT family protein [Dorea sp.]|nr:MBOAT family protein [Dorea sp.]